MPDWIGQNPDEVNELASLFDTKASELDTLVSTITTKLSSTTWQGPDRTRFESQDWAGISTSLTNAAQVLRDTGSVARAQATEQTNASA